MKKKLFFIVILLILIILFFLISDISEVDRSLTSFPSKVISALGFEKTSPTVSQETSQTAGVFEPHLKERSELPKESSPEVIPVKKEEGLMGEGVVKKEEIILVGDGLNNLDAGIYRVSGVSGAFMYDSLDNLGNLTFDVSLIPESSTTPEPSTLILTGIALCLFFLVRRIQRSKNHSRI